ncbi:MAG TPA: LON peptidase substrate-binding domain-containing protein, partial [Gemmataceae bacterium]
MTPTDNVVVLPVLPLKNTVLFPHLFMPLAVGRPNSMAAVEAVLGTEEKSFVVAAQRNADNEQPGLDDLYPVGTRAVIKKMGRGEGIIELIVQGVERVSLLKAEQSEPFLKVRVQPLPEPHDDGTEVEAMYRAVVDLAA